MSQDDGQAVTESPETTARIHPVEQLVVPALTLSAWLGAAFWFNMSVDQIGLSAMGFGFLMCAWLAWRHGIIGYSLIKHEEGDAVPAERTPLPRGLLTPALIIAGAALVIAATPTGAGDILYGPVSAAIGAYEFAQATWGWFVTGALAVILVGGVITGVVRRDAELAFGGVFAIAFFSCGFGLAYLFYRTSDNEAYRSDWEKGFEPIRLVIGLFD